MTNNVKNNLLPNEPQLADLMAFARKEIFQNLNVHHVGTIQSFNSLQQTATATINYKKTFTRFDEVAGYKSVSVDYPPITDCPVVILGGGDGHITFPIEQGDECIILINDRDLDGWFAGSDSSDPPTLRTHSFADALILVGVRSLSNAVATYDPSAVTIRKGDNTIKIYDDRVEVSLGLVGLTNLVLYDTGKLEINNPTGEFVSALSQLFADIQSATTNTMFGPQPLIMPTFVADLAIFNSFKV